MVELFDQKANEIKDNSNLYDVSNWIDLMDKKMNQVSATEQSRLQNSTDVFILVQSNWTSSEIDSDAFDIGFELTVDDAAKATLKFIKKTPDDIIDIDLGSDI